MKSIILLLVTFSLLTFNTSATIKTSLGGNWNQAAAWLPDGVPLCGDTIIIPFDISVQIPANVNLNNNNDPLCAATHIEVSGEVTFANGVKIRLALGACMDIKLGGTLIPAKLNKNGKSNQIEIDKVDWWTSGEGVIESEDIGGIQLGCAIILPITLTNYSIQAVNKRVVVEFVTASERDIQYYEIENSRYGSYWTSIATQEPIGGGSYIFNDETPLNGTSYYRLRYVNMNDTPFNMAIMAIEFQTIEYVVYPVPVKTTMVLEGPNLKDSKITTINSVGEYIKVAKNIASDKCVFDFANIRNGIYFIVIETSNTTNTERVVVFHN